MYFGERKVGTRFYEFIFRGYRCLLVENDCIRTVFLLDKGADIISFVDKKTDTEFVWTNPMGISCLDKIRNSKMDDECFSDNYVGGWFEILPNVGADCEVLGKRFFRHAEVAYMPWDYTVVKDSEEEIELLFITRLSKFPLEVRKTLSLKRDDKALNFREEIINLSKETIPFNWGFHPNIGKPFLDENCIIELEGNSFEMPECGSNKGMLEIFNDVKNPYACIYNKNNGTGLEIKWDSEKINNCWLWISAGYDQGHHHHNGTYVCCILPTSARDDNGLAEAEKNNSCLFVSGEEACEIKYSIGVMNKAV